MKALTPMDNNEDSVSRFIALLKAGIEAWAEAAAIARDALKQDDEWADKVTERCPWVTTQAVRRFAMVGVNFIPQLLIDECPGAKALRKLPLALQEEWYSKPLPLFVKTENGWEPLSVDLHALTPDQAAQVFAADHVRDEQEQRTWIEDKKMKESAPERPNPSWRKVGNEIIVLAGTRFKKRDVERLLEEFKK